MFLAFVIIVIVVLIGMSIVVTNKTSKTIDKKRDAQLQKLADRDAKTQALMDEQKALLEEITKKVGDYDVMIPIKIKRGVIKMEWVYIHYAEETFFVSLSKKQIYYKERFVAFDKIIDCDYTDNATTTATQNGKASSTITTDTRSTVGRAIVGGAIAGSAGAIIGGGTAKKNAETTISNKTVSTTTHDYTIRIHVADIINPLMEIKCWENEEATHKILSTIYAIIEQNKQLSH